MIHFLPDEYKAVYAGEQIQLLPKEFALFQFLYEHPERTFSRDELLEHVWRLEEPSDRTVDDHVYRLRKKLTVWSHLLSLATVRGQGYKLTRHKTEKKKNPLLQDEQFVADINRMMSKYHGLGMGAALQLLSANRDVLGLPGDPFYDVYVRFVSGDFQWLIETDSISFWNKSGYLLYLHAIMQFDAQASLTIYERLIPSLDLIPVEWVTDIKLNAIFCYIKTNQLVKAREQLRLLKPAIMELNSDSFKAVFLIMEIYMHLLSGEREEAEDKVQECEAMLSQNPIQRELGALLVAKAMLLYSAGSQLAARQTLDESIEIIKQTRFVPHLIHCIHIALFYMQKSTFPADEEYIRKYKRVWEQLAEQYRFPDTIRAIERFFHQHL